MPTIQTETNETLVAGGLNPAVIFETLQRYQHSLALKGAIELEIFTRLSGRAKTAKELAAEAGAAERGVRVLCDFLTVLGFLTKGGGVYHLTRESAAFLDKGSPAYMGSLAQFLASDTMLDSFRDVAGLVRKGGALEEGSLLAPENDRWVHFARAMAPATVLPAQMAAAWLANGYRGRLKVLDIAAGAGLFGISIARMNPQAEIVALDWRNVLGVAEENAMRFGVRERFHRIDGDAFKVDLGSGYDLVLLPNFLHHFGAPAIVGLLKRVRAAMREGGRVATIEFVPNEDRVSPPIAAAFAMTMLGNTEAGDAYTFKEYEGMFHEAGFGRSEQVELPPTPFTMIVTAV